MPQTRPATNHAGLPLEATAELFAEAPPEIGEVLSARSTLVAGGATRPSTSERAWSALYSMVVWGVFGWVLYSFGWNTPMTARLLHWVHETAPSVAVHGRELLAVTGALIGWFRVKKTHEVSYVGREGIAASTFVDDPRAARRSLLMRFADAAELRTGQTHHLRKGRYQGTAYFFRWTDARGKVLADFGGWHHSRSGVPGPEDAFHFGRAAELAWTRHMVARAGAELERHGEIKFPVTGKDWVGVGPGFLDLCFGGKPPLRSTRDELERVSVTGGQFSITRKDAQVGWFSSEGVFEFAFESMANARLFLHCVEHIGGMKPS